MKFNLTAFGTGFTQGLADNIQQQRDRRAKIADNLALYTRKKGVDLKAEQDRIESFMKTMDSGDNNYLARIQQIDPEADEARVREMMRIAASTKDGPAAMEKMIFELRQYEQRKQTAFANRNIKMLYNTETGMLENVDITKLSRGEYHPDGIYEGKRTKYRLNAPTTGTDKPKVTKEKIVLGREETRQRSDSTSTAPAPTPAPAVLPPQYNTLPAPSQDLLRALPQEVLDLPVGTEGGITPEMLKQLQDPRYPPPSPAMLDNIRAGNVKTLQAYLNSRRL